MDSIIWRFLTGHTLPHTYANGCWQVYAKINGESWINGTRHNAIMVVSEAECQQLCIDTEGCAFFTVNHLRMLNKRANGKCRLYSDAGYQAWSKWNVIAGRAECPHESWSLKSRGKSRADLWAFASLVAIEEGIQRHNWACDGDRKS